MPMRETWPTAVASPVGMRRVLVYSVTGLSGLCGLGYEMVWTRSLAVSLGRESIAVLAVLLAFFIGLALGGWGPGQRIRTSQRPDAWYAALEVGIALWAVALTRLIPLFNAQLPKLLGPAPTPLLHWGLAFGGTLLLLGPATVAMGATLPALERVAASSGAGEQAVAGLYSANTLGAVAGTLLASFWLVPRYGYTATLFAFATLNVGCAATLVLGLRSAVSSGRGVQAGSALEADALERRRLEPDALERPLLAALFLTGFLGLGYEVVVVRCLSQTLHDTLYTFAAILAVYLSGSALGAALYRRWASRQLAPRSQGGVTSNELTTGRLVAATSLACALGALALSSASFVRAELVSRTGQTLVAGVVSEVSLALWVLLLPSACMGALFGQLAERVTARTGLGLGLGVNTLGAGLAPAVVGIGLLPWLGTKTTLLLLASAYLLLIPKALGRRRWPLTALPLSLAALVWLGPVSLRVVTLPPGGQLLEYREGVMASVAVVSDAGGERFLKVDDQLTMGGTASAFSDQRQTHLPLLLHGSAEQALFLGVGTGVTFDAAKDYPGLHATGVELVPELLGLLRHFGTDPRDTSWATPPALLAADARRFILATPARYDVVIAELFHPWQEGSASLYTLEHFEAVRQHLLPGGLFCQWLPLYQMDLDTLRIILRTFLAVFPSVQAHLGHYSLEQPILALVGRGAPPRYEPGWLAQRVHSPVLQRKLVELRLNSDFALLGGFLADEAGLESFAGRGALNTDDHPLVAFRAASFVYGAASAPRTRLLELVDALAPERSSTGRASSSTSFVHAAGAGQAPDFDARLERYWQARDAYLHTGAGVRSTADVADIVARTKAPLLAVVRLSADFAPAYAPLLAMARGVYADDPLLAKQLLSELSDANPERPEARALYTRLFGR